jgi:hypothetical protein
MASKYFVLFTFMKAAGAKGVTPEAAAKEINLHVGQVGGYIKFLREKFSAEIGVTKNGRSIEKYVLLNASVVEGLITPSRRSTATAKAKPVKKTVTKAARAKVIKQVVEKRVKVKNTKPVADNGDMSTFDPDLHIAEFGDNDLADIKAQLGL